MNTVEVKTADLIGRALDWAVAVAVGQPLIIRPIFGLMKPDTMGWNPSTDWAQLGPLIASLHITLDFNTAAKDDPDYDPEPWMACRHSGRIVYGATPLIAACRAIVARELGYTVMVPAELINGGEK